MCNHVFLPLLLTISAKEFHVTDSVQYSVRHLIFGSAIVSTCGTTNINVCVSRTYMHYCAYRGEVTIRGEVMHNTRDNLVVTFAANKLSNKEGFFGTSDPFLKISR